MDSNVFLWVLLGPCLSLLILMGLIGYLSVLMHCY